MWATGPPTGRRALSGDPGESAREGRAASTRPGPPPRRPADTVVAEASLPVAFPARAVPARLLDPRAPPYPGPAPGAGGPLPPWRPGSIQTVLPSPAPRSPRDPRSLPGVAGAVAFPAPPPPLHAGPGAEWASRFFSRNKEAAAAAAERGVGYEESMKTGHGEALGDLTCDVG
ncbi:WW domain-binding protein 11-like [Bos javanicus]|uniref:WW domain-binding protein 11-like n=1 Tax=Bos javanicus TaxID=9906 RepID=UPI002AA5FEFE|nr:WW domain-binding protein 11-like [Bos javanicus]XP_061278179.1 WW domain-binding protein 11-like [Bos javanicus]XP_061278180.1 WW domain-binding protein 11-like [Bos javanicus]